MNNRLVNVMIFLLFKVVGTLYRYKGRKVIGHIYNTYFGSRDTKKVQINGCCIHI